MSGAEWDKLAERLVAKVESIDARLEIVHRKVDRLESAIFDGADGSGLVSQVALLRHGQTVRRKALELVLGPLVATVLMGGGALLAMVLRHLWTAGAN